MATATIVNAWQDGRNAYLAVSVSNDGTGAAAGASVEYQGSTPLFATDGTQKPLAQLKSELVAACKAQRDAQRAQAAALAVSGTVTI